MVSSSQVVLEDKLQASLPLHDAIAVPVAAATTIGKLSFPVAGSLSMFSRSQRKLVSKNYLSWCQQVELVIKAELSHIYMSFIDLFTILLFLPFLKNIHMAIKFTCCIEKPNRFLERGFVSLICYHIGF